DLRSAMPDRDEGGTVAGVDEDGEVGAAQAREGRPGPDVEVGERGLLRLDAPRHLPDLQGELDAPAPRSEVRDDDLRIRHHRDGAAVGEAHAHDRGRSRVDLVALRELPPWSKPVPCAA